MRVAILVLALGSAVCAGAQATPSAALDYRVTFSALDDKGSPAQVEQSDLIIEVSGRPTVIRDLKHFRETPIRLVIVLDTSGSMRKKWDAALLILFRLLKGLPKDSVVGLLGFSDEHGEVLLKPESIANALRRYSNNKVRPEGRTRLWDNVVEALEVFKRPELGDAVILITDGGDNMSKTSFSQLEKITRERPVRIFSALLMEPFSASPEERSGPPDVFRLVSENAGWNLTSDPFFKDYMRTKDVDTVMERFNRALADFYVAEITLGRPITKREKLKLKVEKRLDQKHRPLIAAPESLLPRP